MTVVIPHFKANRISWMLEHEKRDLAEWLHRTGSLKGKKGSRLPLPPERHQGYNISIMGWMFLEGVTELSSMRGLSRQGLKTQAHSDVYSQRHKGPSYSHLPHNTFKFQPPTHTHSEGRVPPSLH